MSPHHLLAWCLYLIASPGRDLDACAATPLTHAAPVAPPPLCSAPPPTSSPGAPSCSPRLVGPGRPHRAPPHASPVACCSSRTRPPRSAPAATGGHADARDSHAAISAPPPPPARLARPDPDACAAHPARRPVAPGGCNHRAPCIKYQCCVQGIRGRPSVLMMSSRCLTRWSFQSL